MTAILRQIMTVVLLAVAALFVQQTSDIWDTKRHNSQADRLLFPLGQTQSLGDKLRCRPSK